MFSEDSEERGAREGKERVFGVREEEEDREKEMAHRWMRGQRRRRRRSGSQFLEKKQAVSSQGRGWDGEKRVWDWKQSVKSVVREGNRSETENISRDSRRVLRQTARNHYSLLLTDSEIISIIIVIIIRGCVQLHD